MSSAEPLVLTRRLTKRFAAFTAVDGIDFDVRAGEALGFLGPNGAGKTSTMRMIGCTSPVTEGELRVLGMDPRTQGSQIKSRLGVVPQTDNLDAELTVRENLLMYARYFDIPREIAARRVDELLTFVQLSDRADAEVEPLSGGMKRAPDVISRFIPSWRRSRRMVQRNLLIYKHGWMVIFSGFLEPLFYLLSLGLGLGAMVPDIGDISYGAFVAPGLLASSCMNGAITDGFFNIFFKLHFQKTWCPG